MMMLLLHAVWLAAATHAELLPASNRQRRLEETETSCASILFSSYTSDFQEQMDPCSCRELVDGRFRVECKYDYCEHCVGSTCGVQDTVHIYDAAGEEETTFLCVSYTSGEREGTEVCFAFGTSATSDDDAPTDDASSNLFCSVEIDGKSCVSCQYNTCSNGLTQPRVDCGADAYIDLCNRTTDITVDSPLAMFRTDFTFSSCFFDIGGTSTETTRISTPTMSPEAAPRLVGAGLSPSNPASSPSIAPIPANSESSSAPTTVRFAQINTILQPPPNATAIPADTKTVAPTTSPVTESVGVDDDDGSLLSNTQIDAPDDAPTASSASWFLAVTTPVCCLIPVLVLVLLQ